MSVWVVVWLACSVIGALIAENRGHHRSSGFFAGLLLGVLGLVLLVLIPKGDAGDTTGPVDPSAAETSG